MRQSVNPLNREEGKTLAVGVAPLSLLAVFGLAAWGYLISDTTFAVFGMLFAALYSIIWLPSLVERSGRYLVRMFTVPLAVFDVAYLYLLFWTPISLAPSLAIAVGFMVVYMGYSFALFRRYTVRVPASQK
jgi:hypothetical protein